MKLYDYYRSSSSYRVRIALNIKEISYELIAIHLVNQGGEQHSPAYHQLNPQELVPTLDENGHILTQSLAIIEYLDELVPNPPLLPNTPFARAEVRSLAQLIACDMHPLNNLRVLQYLRQSLKSSESQVLDWYHTWLKQGFDAFEERLRHLPRKQAVCYGQDITLADLCLIPQVYNANRYEFSLTPYPLIQAINEYCLSLDAFAQAAPEYTVATS